MLNGIVGPSKSNVGVRQSRYYVGVGPSKSNVGVIQSSLNVGVTS